MRSKKDIQADLIAVSEELKQFSQPTPLLGFSDPKGVSSEKAKKMVELKDKEIKLIKELKDIAIEERGGF